MFTWRYLNISNPLIRLCVRGVQRRGYVIAWLDELRANLTAQDDSALICRMSGLTPGGTTELNSRDPFLSDGRRPNLISVHLTTRSRIDNFIKLVPSLLKVVAHNTETFYDVCQYFAL